MLSNRILSACVGALAVGLAATGAMAAGGHGGGGGGFQGGGGGGFHAGGFQGYRAGGFAGRGYGERFHGHRHAAFYGPYGYYDDGYGDDDCYWRGRRWVCSY